MKIEDYDFVKACKKLALLVSTKVHSKSWPGKKKCILKGQTFIQSPCFDHFFPQVPHAYKHKGGMKGGMEIGKYSH